MIRLEKETLISILYYDLGLDYFGSLAEVISADPFSEFDFKFDTIIQQALKEFELHFPNRMETKISVPYNEEYIFTDNFQSYLNGNISEKHIELIPKSIIRIGNTISSDYWRYYPPKLKISSGMYKVIYLTYYPYYNHTIYYIDKNNIRFIILLEIRLIENILNTTKSVNTGISINFFENLENYLQVLKEKYENYISTRTKIIELWDKRRWNL